MRRILKIYLFILILTRGIPLVWSQSTDLGQILSAPDDFDSRTVELEAEIIGEPLGTGKGIWINIKDDYSNLGVFIKEAKQLEGIEHWGSYKEKGDRLKIKGVFNKDCPRHQISDLHLQDFRVIERGYIRKLEVLPQKKRGAYLLSIIWLITALMYFIKVKYGK